MGQQRIVELDMMKGIGILAMICCHRLNGIVWLDEFIHSFHMPLFVFISGYLFHQRPLAEWAIRMARRLLLPFAVVLIILLLFDRTVPVSERLDAVLTSYPPVWVIWFLMALFFCQFLAECCMEMPWSIVIIIWSACLLPSYEKIHLPVYVGQGLFMYPFFCLGHVIARQGWLEKSTRQGSHLRLLPVALLIWTAGLYYEPASLRFSTCHANWLLYGDVLVSASACFVIFLFCRWLAHRPSCVVPDFLGWIGKASIVFFCLHAIDHIYLQGFPWIGLYWQYTGFLGEYAWAAGYLCLELPLLCLEVWMVMQIKYLRYLFGI